METLTIWIEGESRTYQFKRPVTRIIFDFDGQLQPEAPVWGFDADDERVDGELVLRQPLVLFA